MTVWPRNPAVGSTPQRTEDRIANKNLDTSVHGGIVPDNQRVETTQMPVDRFPDEEKHGVFIQKNIIQPSKGRADTRYSMDEL